jgi:hypothetical protein
LSPRQTFHAYLRRVLNSHAKEAYTRYGNLSYQVLHNLKALHLLVLIPNFNKNLHVKIQDSKVLFLFIVTSIKENRMGTVRSMQMRYKHFMGHFGQKV